MKINTTETETYSFTIFPRFHPTQLIEGFFRHMLEETTLSNPKPTHQQGYQLIEVARIQYQKKTEQTPTVHRRTILQTRTHTTQHTHARTEREREVPIYHFLDFWSKFFNLQNKDIEGYVKKYMQYLAALKRIRVCVRTRVDM